jgi:hypothetical protein
VVTPLPTTAAGEKVITITPVNPAPKGAPLPMPGGTPSAPANLETPAAPLPR